MIQRVLAGAVVAGVLLLTPGTALASGNPCADGYTRGCHTGYPSPSSTPSSTPSNTPSPTPSTTAPTTAPAHHSTPPAHPSTPAAHHSTPPQRLPTTGPDGGDYLMAGAAILALGVGLLILSRTRRRRTQ